MMSYFSEMDSNLFAAILTVITMGFLGSLLYILYCYYVLRSFIRQFHASKEILKKIMHEDAQSNMLEDRVIQLARNSEKLQQLFEDMCAMITSTGPKNEELRSLNNNVLLIEKVGNKPRDIKQIEDLLTKAGNQINNITDTHNGAQFQTHFLIFKTATRAVNKNTQWQKYIAISNELCAVALNSCKVIEEIASLTLAQPKYIDVSKKTQKRFVHSEHDS